MKTWVLPILIFFATLDYGLSSTGVELLRGAKIPVLIEWVDSETQSLGLTKEFIQAKVELRLRQNGLEPIAVSPFYQYYIYIQIGTVGSAFTWNVEFNRPVEYKLDNSSFSMTACTYNRNGLGTYRTKRSARDFIMDQVLSAIDILSNEILKSQVG